MTDKKNSFTRKDFLRIVVAAGTVGLGAKTAWKKIRSPVVVEDTRILMGTVINLTVVGGNPQNARKAVEICFTRMEDLESQFSRFQPESQLSRLNQLGVLPNPTRDFIEVVESAQQISQQSEGKFDITVKPLVDLYQQYTREGKGLPPLNEVEKKMTLVDFRKINLEGNIIRFSDPEMSITLDGIAKGYIVDQGVETLQRQGYRDVLVEAGGDLVAAGFNPKKKFWRIGILSPRGRRGEILTRVSIQNQAVATSGDYLEKFSTDALFHHVIDPHRGTSSPALASVSVVAPSGMLADGYATAAMVLGPEEGAGLIEKVPHVEALLVTKSMEAIMTSGFDTVLREKS